MLMVGCILGDETTTVLMDCLKSSMAERLKRKWMCKTDEVKAEKKVT